MLSIILFIIIGRSFYQLADKFDQNKWLYAILGIASYYAGTLVGGFCLGLLDGTLDLGIDWENKLTLLAVALPFGLTAVLIFYFLLKKNWEKNYKPPTDEIAEIGKSEED